MRSIVESATPFPCGKHGCRLQGEGVSLADVIQEDALKWTESFAADSFGDSLFALALSPLTGSSVSAPVKVLLLPFDRNAGARQHSNIM